MNIIQSYYSSPFRAKTNSVFDRNNGGWSDERQHAMSWSLSCLKLKQFYPELQLYTDGYGLEWLIDKLALPYKEVYKSLEGVPQLNSSLWALSKLFVYSLQSEPFLHIDGDVFIWEPFSPGFLTSELIAQNVEYDTSDNSFGDIYISTALKFLNAGTALPQEVLKSIIQFKDSGIMYGYNTGIVGGSNTIFFKEYTRSVFKFIKDHQDQRYEGKDMSFFEQLFFHAMASALNLKVSVLSGPQPAVAPAAYADMMQFNFVPITEKYIHVVGIGKRNQVPSRQVAMRLKYEFPKQYQHIMSVYPVKDFYLQESLGQDNLVINSFPYTCKLLQKIGFVHTGRSKETFINDIETIVSKELKTTALQMLSDFFHIEYFQHKITCLPLKPHQPDQVILDHLYSKSREQFLDLKMTFNSDAGKLISAYFSFPQDLTAESLSDSYREFENSLAVGRPQLAMLIAQNKEMKFETLSPWGSLLLYFEDEAHSGNDLIDYLIKQKLMHNMSQFTLVSQVFSFITTYSVCYNYLILSN